MNDGTGVFSGTGRPDTLESACPAVKTKTQKIRNVRSSHSTSFSWIVPPTDGNPSSSLPPPSQSQALEGTLPGTSLLFLPPEPRKGTLLLASLLQTSVCTVTFYCTRHHSVRTVQQEHVSRYLSLCCFFCTSRPVDKVMMSWLVSFQRALLCWCRTLVSCFAVTSQTFSVVEAGVDGVELHQRPAVLMLRCVNERNVRSTRTESQMPRP